MNPQLEKERARRAQALQHRLYDQQLTRLGLSNAVDAPDFRGKSYRPWLVRRKAGSSASEMILSILLFIFMIVVGILALLFAPQ